ncbi:MAG: hypothetical protein LBN21_04055 [Treponema sp.]|nr:hypothetical protein [Treponema sp.]
MTDTSKKKENREVKEVEKGKRKARIIYILHFFFNFFALFDFAVKNSLFSICVVPKKVTDTSKKKENREVEKVEKGKRKKNN